MPIPERVLTAAEEARRRKRGTKGWKLSELDQEIAWRKWFPQDNLDWAESFDDETTDRMVEACVSFLEANMQIKVPGKGKVPFRLRDAQKSVLRDWIKNRRTVALKARQVGFSTLAAGYALWLTFGWPDRLVIMLSRGERESIALLRKSKDAYKNMPEWVKFRGPKLMDRTRQVMTFGNESCIQSLPSASEPGRGESVFCVIVDEWAFLPNPEEAWASIEPITDIGGRVIGISTAKGEGNFFHKLWLGSQNHTNSFRGIFHPWWAVDNRDKAWYEQKCRDLEPWQVAQEYPSNPEEAFVGSGNPVFNLANLRRFEVSPAQWFGSISVEKGKKRPELIEHSNGALSIWEHPNDENRFSYVIGADIAEGLEHGDFTVAYVMCVQTRQIVAIWHGKEDPDVFGELVLPALGWYYRFAVIAPEVNNHGLTVLKALQRAKYGRIYRRRSLTKRTDRALETMGWLTTAQTKPLLVDELAAWLRDQETNVQDDATIAELRSFARDAKGKMSGQPHDDRVMALGMTIQCLKYAMTEAPISEAKAENVKGTFAWYEKKLDKRDKKRKLRASVAG